MTAKPPIACACCGRMTPARTIRKDACYSCRYKHKKAEAMPEPQKQSSFSWLDLGRDSRPNINDNQRYIPSDVASKHYRNYSL